MSQKHWENGLMKASIKLARIRGKKKAFLEMISKKVVPTTPTPIAVVGNGVEVKKSRISNAGNGLFSSRIFEKGETISEYCGSLVWKDTLPKRIPKSHLFNIGNGWCIDGVKSPEFAKRRKLGGASFCNDPRITSSRNAKLKRVSDNSVDKVFVVATKKIYMDEEILVSYGTDYWKRQKSKK